MRRLHGVFVSTSLFFVALDASAAPPSPGGAQGPRQSNAQFALHREEAGGPDGATARSRARAGDCSGALPSFDAAIRVTIEPTLRRDRGLCHEKLGDAFPAMDDFRVYLAARPDANDADQIRERLLHLEEQTGTGGKNVGTSKEEGSRTGIANEPLEGQHGTVSGRKKRRNGPNVSESKYDEYVSQEKLADEAEYAPLRYGQGWSLGPTVQLPRYFFDSHLSKDLAYSVGGSLRYSTSGSFMINAEAGYASAGESGTAVHVSGPLLFLGGIYRVGLSRYNTDQLMLGLGVGFERYTSSSSTLGYDIVPLRAKLGYMHVFGPSVGLEVAVDGGPAYLIPDTVGNKVVGVVGGSLALLVGF